MIKVEEASPPDHDNTISFSPPSASRSSATVINYEDIATRLAKQESEPPFLSHDAVWAGPSNVKEMEGIFLAKMQLAQFGVRFVFSKNQFWSAVDKCTVDSHFETFSRKEVDVNLKSGESFRLIHHCFRLLSTETGDPRGAMRDVCHFPQVSYEQPIRIYFAQRSYKIRSKHATNKFGQSSFRVSPSGSPPPSTSSRKRPGDTLVATSNAANISCSASSSSPFSSYKISATGAVTETDGVNAVTIAAAPLYRELAPFTTFTLCVNWTAPYQATPEWTYFYRSQYAVDLWTLAVPQRMELCAYLLNVMRRASIEMLSGSPDTKLSKITTANGIFAVPPTSPPKACALDEEDEQKLTEIWQLLTARPYVRVVFPYLTWYVRREKHYDFPHWTGGSYSGWVREGVPHRRGKLTLLLPNAITFIDGEYDRGVLHGAVTQETMNTQSSEMVRFQGRYERNKRIYGIQEWFVRTSTTSSSQPETQFLLAKRFQGSWNGDEPAVGIWE